MKISCKFGSRFSQKFRDLDIGSAFVCVDEPGFYIKVDVGGMAVNLDSGFSTRFSAGSDVIEMEMNCVATPIQRGE